MHVWRSRVRDPGAIVENIQRRRNELSHFIPKIRQRQIGQMNQKNYDSEAGVGFLRELFANSFAARFARVSVQVMEKLLKGYGFAAADLFADACKVGFRGSV